MKSNFKKLLVLFTAFSIFGIHDSFGMKANVKDLQNNYNLNASGKIEIVKISNPIKCNYRLKRDGEDLIDFIKYNNGVWSIVDRTKIWHMPKNPTSGWIALMEVSAFKRFVGLSKDDFYDKNLDTLSEILTTGGISGLLIHFLENFATCYNALCQDELPKEKDLDIYNSLLGFDSFCQALRDYRISLGVKAGKNEDDLFSKFKEIKEKLVKLMESKGSIRI